MAAVAADFIIVFIRERYDVPERGQARVEIESPDGLRLGGSNVEFDLERGIRFRVTLKLPGIPIVGAGMYHFVVEFNQTTNGYKQQDGAPSQDCGFSTAGACVNACSR